MGRGSGDYGKFKGEILFGKRSRGTGKPSKPQLRNSCLPYPQVDEYLQETRAPTMCGPREMCLLIYLQSDAQGDQARQTSAIAIRKLALSALREQGADHETTMCVVAHNNAGEVSSAVC